MNQPLCQRDSRWASVKLGNTNHTIGRIGCTITSLAWLNNTTPDKYAKKFKFTPEGRVYWSSVPDFKYRHYSKVGLHEAVLEGKKVIVEVDGVHWVAVVDFNRLTADYVIMDPWTGEFIEWDSLIEINPYDEITGWAEVGIRELEPSNWITAKKKKPTFPVPVPDAVALPLTTPLNQGKTNACTVFSVLYALSVMKRLKGQEMNLDPLKTHENILKKRYGEIFEYNPNMSVSYQEVFEYLKEQKEIRKYREITLDPNDWKIKIFQGFPVMVTIKHPHAVCLVGYDGDEFTAHDSLFKNPYRKLDREVVEAYIMFL